MVENMVNVMAEHCRDSSLAGWKQKLISLAELMKTYPGKISLESTWVQGVFLLILDVEAKASDKVLECTCLVTLALPRGPQPTTTP
jgi:hypothetical protein